MKGVWVGLEHNGSRFGFDAVFIDSVILKAGRDLAFPHASVADALHGIGFSVPLVKITYNGDRTRIRRPNPKDNALPAAVRAQEFIGLVIGSLMKQAQLPVPFLGRVNILHANRPPFLSNSIVLFHHINLLLKFQGAFVI